MDALAAALAHAALRRPRRCGLSPAGAQQNASRDPPLRVHRLFRRPDQRLGLSRQRAHNTYDVEGCLDLVALGVQAGGGGWSKPSSSLLRLLTTRHIIAKELQDLKHRVLELS